jgi:soluble lytic murein transglycosylase
MYWHARSFYRINNKEGFARVKNDFEKRYPDNRRLALLYLMEADELRRQGNLLLAQKSYEVVASRFPKNAEEALWGLGWMYYSAGNFEKSLEYFSRLTEYERSRDYHKYLYWNARSQERMSEDGEDDFFQELPSDRSYYGYMIKMRSPVDEISESILPSVPVFPKGEQYQRINALAVMGMKDEAVLEITESIKKARSPGEFLYLGHMAMKLDAYKDVIYIAEPRDDLEFLPYSYPRAYWETIKHAAGSEGVDEHLVAALIREESRYDPDVVSWAGAVGLMQLLPATAKRMNNGVTVHTGGSLVLSDVRTNIMLGTHYLSRLVREFKEIPFAVAAYNAGENALRRWLNKYYRRDVAEFIENIPYKETRRYVKKVLKSYWQYRTISGLQLSGIGDDEPLVIDEGSGLAQLTPDPAP